MREKRYKNLILTTIAFLLGVNAWAVGQIFVNQTGYLPDAPKYVFTTQNATEFEVIDAGSGQVAFSGTLALFRSNDPATGLTLYRGDFSSLQQPGAYKLTIGGTHSTGFVIADTAYRDIYYKSLKSFYFQRCGIDLTSSYAGIYARAKCHQADAFLHSSTGQSGFVLNRYSWHDAGDFGKYSGPAAVTIGELLMAYEYFPDKFSQDDLNIPESGNAVPDILDETRYALRWLLTMQHSSGGIYHKLTAENFSGMIMPAQDSAQRFLYQISSTATAATAAVLARAARVFAAFDTAFANQCLNAAVQAWAFLQANPNIVPPGGFQNPPGTGTGEYGDGNDRDERLWAAAELFETTGSGSYKTVFQSLYGQLGLFTGEPGWQNVKSLALLTYLRSQQATADQGIIALLGASLDSYCSAVMADRNANGFHVSINPGQYNWGSNGRVLNRGMMLLFGALQTGNDNYRSAALDQLHYVLGMNAHNISFVTGTGNASPMHIHHRPSEADNIADPIPGLLAGGPDQYRSDPVLQANFTQNTPPALCYIDDLGSYASNEVAIYWNAPLVLLSGYFNNSMPTGISSEPNSGVLSPVRFRLDQNYPNPFNGGTTIPFELFAPAEVRIRVFNTLGQVVEQQDFPLLPAGTHRWHWAANDLRGNLLSSGTYHVELTGNGQRQMRSVVLLK